MVASIQTSRDAATLTWTYAAEAFLATSLPQENRCRPVVRPGLPVQRTSSRFAGQHDPPV